jgi:transglutaminase-like putative cysteine protease
MKHDFSFTRCLWLPLIMIFFASCSGDHFINDRQYRKKVEAQFEKQKSLAKHRSGQLFDVFDQALTTRENEALMFLYAYSSLNDLADYDGGFFLKNIRASFAARDTFAWGKTVPEEIFRHFVLPVRVNNENLDSSRWVFFAELKDRIRFMPMGQAALEVNHWCHEKVTYRGTDGRTSSPLATVKTAYGRCGEESTFTVAALRSVGIPARQCYTPRWAHSDDNHAWVEVWVDGKWHFIGACEPDAALDLAWFTKPATRAMLVNTTVFGDYSGPEEILVKDERFTRINVLQNYTKVKKVHATVLNTDRQPVDSAVVEFQLYNYAEFYPLHRTITDEHGMASFITGYGDLLVWAAAKGNYGFSKLDVRTLDTVTIILQYNGKQPSTNYIDFIPPAESKVAEEISDSLKKKNSARLEFEDKIRTAYEATFIDSLKTIRFAALVNLDKDSLWSFMKQTRGNWREITEFITNTPVSKRHLVFPLLSSISSKDLRDVHPDVLLDAILTFDLVNFDGLTTQEVYQYLLSPRVDNEWLKPCREYLRTTVTAEYSEKSGPVPPNIVNWIKNNIKINSIANYSRAPITPTGVFELKHADPHSCDIFFVAVCRSSGIPARLEPATKVPQYWSGSAWIEVNLSQKQEQEQVKGFLTLSSNPENEKSPEYSTHFTVESQKDGFYRTLDFEGSPLVSKFPCTVEIPAGPSMIVTGSRLNTGTVLAKLQFFNVPAKDTITQELELRKNENFEGNFGKLNPELFEKINTGNMILFWMEPGKEPTKRLLAEIRNRKDWFAKWNGHAAMIFPNESIAKEFKEKECAILPANISYSFAATFPIKLNDLSAIGVETNNLPVVLFVMRDGVVTYRSQGFKTGIIDELYKLMKHD